MVARILILILIGHFAAADNTGRTDDLCWTNESNPTSELPYSSRSDWTDDLITWSRLYKPQLNLVLLYRAFKVYKREKSKATSFPNDKMAHCYVGCRISQETNLRTARFVGWLKEDLDLTDCDLSTHFDPKDYIATLKGAEAGQNRNVQCEPACLSLLETLQ